jgi:hypothetical protein
MEEIYITWGASHFPYLSSTYLSYNQNVNFGALYRNVPKQTTRVEQKKSEEILKDVLILFKIKIKTSFMNIDC